MRQAAVPPPENANQAFTSGCWSRLLWAIGVADASPQDPGSLTYEPYFGLQEKPFSLSPDPRFFFRNSSHGAAFNTLVAGLRRREGILTLTGEVGTGKTTLCRAVLQGLDRKTFAAFVPDPCLSREDLLRKLLVDFGVATLDEMRRGRMHGASRTDLSYPLYEFLASLKPLQAFAVVIVDEAQNLPAETLEEIRILSDLDNRQKLLEVLLVGQPELQSRLATSATRHLSQRVSIRCELSPLTGDEVGRYVSHRLATAGGDGSVRFMDAAIDLVHVASDGIPRVVNLVCDRALAGAARSRTATVDAQHVLWAVDDLKLPVARSSQSSSQDNLVPRTESPAKPLGEASTAHEPERQAPPQDEALVPAADPVANAPLGGPPDRALSPVASSKTWFGIELDDTRGNDAPEIAAPELSFEGVKTVPPHRTRLLALIGAGLVLGGLGGYWYSRPPVSRLSSDVLAQPAQPRLPPQAPPAGSVTLSPTSDVPLARSPTPPPSRTESNVYAPGASASLVSPPGERAWSQNPAQRQTPMTFMLQMATFQSPARAEQSLQDFRDAGYRAHSTEVSLKDGAPAVAVFLGPYAELAAAEQDLARARQIPGYASGRIVQTAASGRPPTPRP